MAKIPTNYVCADLYQQPLFRSKRITTFLSRSVQVHNIPQRHKVNEGRYSIMCHDTVSMLCICVYTQKGQLR